MGEEHPLAGDGLERLIGLIETHLDLDLLRRIAGERQEVQEKTATVPLTTICEPIRIGVARDAAFCFYYEDNFDLLRQAGAELVFFSPLTERDLPPGLSGLYLGGGYPELHARALSGNAGMRSRIRDFAASGRPIYAECGGFMYLCQSLTDLQSITLPMVGLYPFRARMQARLRSLGYRQPVVTRDCLFGPAGAVLHGHEFHYSTIEQGEEEVVPAFCLEDGRPEGFTTCGNTLAGYVHLHWGRTPEVAERFVEVCRQASIDTTTAVSLHPSQPKPLNT
jgi:cobyrinic acid a,c-diamide synthase